ncbi:MAG: VWA domain-containing protein [Polyangiaceae bacterium]|nr:VWA domain-containing protein [Polyangiaceae bacterium]
MKIYSFRGPSGPAFLAFVLFALFMCGCRPAESPESRDPHAVTAEGLLGTPVLLANGESTVYAVVRLGTVPRPAQQRGPVNVALAIDTSGSMEGEGIEAARKSGMSVVDSLADGDRLAIVVFHSKAEILLESEELSPDVRAEAKQKIEAIEARGTTAMGEGLDLALNQVNAHFDAKGINRIVLLGDGIPNVSSRLDYTAQRAAQRGIVITTIGLGLDYDEVLMANIATTSGGRYRYVEAPDKLAAFFKEELGRFDSVYGRHASATLTPGPGVRIDGVVGGQSGSESAYVPLGDITHGDTRDIVVRLIVKPRKPGVPIELLDATIQFDDALEDAGRLERRVYFGAHTTLDEAEVAKAKRPDVELAAALAEASATTIQAMAMGKKGRYLSARDMLTKGAEAAIAQSKRTPSRELEKFAENMRTVAKDMPEVDAPQLKQSTESHGYDFSDDAVNAAPAEAPSPSVTKMRKEVHQQAVDQLY